MLNLWLFLGVLLLYEIACASWGLYALYKFRQLKNAYYSLPRELREANRELERPDYGRLRSWRMILGCFLLVGVRLAIFVPSIINYVLIMKVLTLRCWAESRAVKKLTAFLCTLGGRAGLFCLGVARVIQHDKDLEWDFEQPRNIIANHVSPIDILFFMYSVNPSFVAKRVVSTNCLIGPLARSFDCVFVDRSSAEDRARAGAAIATRQRLVAHGAHERSLVIFPEGTTTNGRYIIPFKSGAFEQNFFVTPCTLIYRCPDFELSYEIIPFSIWFPMVLASPGCATLHAFWMRPMGHNTYLYTAAELAAQTRKEMALVVYREFKDTWCYDENETIPDDWGGTFRNKVAMYQLVMAQLGKKVENRLAQERRRTAAEFIMKRATSVIPSLGDEEEAAKLLADGDRASTPVYSQEQAAEEIDACKLLEDGDWASSPADREEVAEKADTTKLLDDGDKVSPSVYTEEGPAEKIDMLNRLAALAAKQLEKQSSC